MGRRGPLETAVVVEVAESLPGEFQVYYCGQEYMVGSALGQC